MKKEKIAVFHRAPADNMRVIGKALRARIQRAKEDNKHLTPYIDLRYVCETCEQKDGLCHPVNGYCFVCNTDDWLPRVEWDMREAHAKMTTTRTQTPAKIIKI